METGVRRAERGRGDGGMNEGERGCISPRSTDTGIRTGGVMIIHRLLLALHFNIKLYYVFVVLFMSSVFIVLMHHSPPPPLLHCAQ